MGIREPSLALDESNKAFVRFDRVQKSYDGESLVVKDLNLDIPKGEFLTMLGPSGSGKTTCLMMLAGFETATHGEILLDGVSINNIPPHKRGIGMVFQNYALFPHMTVAENLSFPLEVRNLGKSEREAKVKRALDMVEMGDFGGRRPAQLSGGMQQRVGLARALATDAEILLMDEAFSALDPLIRTDMQNILLDLQEELHKTIVFITHDLDEALRIGDEISILRDGEVIQQGDPQSIIMKPADDYISDFIKDINRGRVLEVRSIMEKADRASGPKMGIKTPLEDALQQLVNAGKDSGAVVGGDGKTIGKISMANAIAAMARPDRGDEGPRYK